MHYRNLGKTGLKVSEVGMGCNRLGDPMHEDGYWDDLVRRAIDLGVNNFDTSEAYGKGRSEEVLGRAIGNRDDLYIASKVSPRAIDGVRQITSSIICDAVEKSLKRLQRDCIDVYQLHSPNQEMLQRDDWAEGLLRLREQGKIRHCAIAVNGAREGVWAIEHGVAEVLQITYSIFETSPEEALFDLAKKRGVGLLVRRPMERGVLTGKFRPNQEVASEHRASMEGDKLPQMIERAETLRTIGEAYPGGMTRMALQFSLGPDAVSCIIPGARKMDQVEENVAASCGGGFSGEVRAQIETVRKGWAC
jgi:aryl-alcohol dehydrogenase-like predicted oxidoreductase